MDHNILCHPSVLLIPKHLALRNNQQHKFRGDTAREPIQLWSVSLVTQVFLWVQFIVSRDENQILKITQTLIDS